MSDILAARSILRPSGIIIVYAVVKALCRAAYAQALPGKLDARLGPASHEPCSASSDEHRAQGVGRSWEIGPSAAWRACVKDNLVQQLGCTGHMAWGRCLVYSSRRSECTGMLKDL